MFSWFRKKPVAAPKPFDDLPAVKVFDAKYRDSVPFVEPVVEPEDFFVEDPAYAQWRELSSGHDMSPLLHSFGKCFHECACGWVGQPRNTPNLARVDYRTHRESAGG